MAKNQVIVSITSNTKGLVKGLGESQSALSKLGGVAKTAVGVVAGVGAALVGLAAAGGFSRALNIDTANTKLQALRYNTEEIADITKSALASVSGTAYGLGDAVTLASQALAAGIPQGEALTKSLTLVTNTAALAGVELGDMGSIFAKVWTAGRVGTEELNQLADRGIPIWTTLADSLGVGVDELRKMVSAGEVTAEMFETALAPAVDGIAKVMGTSFKGMLSNAQASLSRFGAMFATPLITASKGVLGEFTVLVDGIAGMLAPVAERFSAWVGGLNIDGLGERILASLQGLTEGGGLNFGSLLSGLLPALTTGIQTAASWIANGGLEPILANIANGRNALLDVAITLFEAIVAALPGIMPALMHGLLTFIDDVVAFIVESVPLILDAGVQAFTSLVQALSVVLPQMVIQLVQMIPTLVGAILTMVPMILDAAILLFTALVDAIPIIVPPLIDIIITTLPVLMETIISMLPGILQAAIDLFTALVEAIPIILPVLLQAVIDLLPELIRTVLSLIPALIQGAVELFKALVTAVPRILPDLIPALVALLPEIIGALIGMVPDLIQAGIDLISGLVSGLWQAAGAVGEALLGIISGAVNGFLAFLGIKSPSRLFAGFGKDTVKGLVQGLTQNGNLIDKAMDGLSGRVEGGFSADLTGFTTDLAGQSLTGPAGGLTATAPVYNIYLSTLNATAETGRVIVESIRDYETFGGRL